MDDGPMEGLFGPEVFLPAQYYANSPGRGEIWGEKLLMLAVLEDALQCYKRYAFVKEVEGRKIFRQACQWISSEDRYWPFSFINICEALEINPDYLRGGLESWKQRMEF